MTCHFFPLLAPGWRKRERTHSGAFRMEVCVRRTTVGAKWYNHSWQLLHVHLTGQPFPNGFIHHPLFILCALLNSRFISGDSCLQIWIYRVGKTFQCSYLFSSTSAGCVWVFPGQLKKKKQIAGIFSPAGQAVPLSVIEAGTRALSQPHTHSEVIFKPINPP